MGDVVLIVVVNRALNLWLKYQRAGQDASFLNSDALPPGVDFQLQWGVRPFTIAEVFDRLSYPLEGDSEWN
jgi:hypothetical protein